jgi:hypothetical protein
MSVGGVDLGIYKNYKAWEQSGEAGQAATSPARYLCFSKSEHMTAEIIPLGSQNTDRPAADCNGPFLTTAAIQIDLSVPYLNTSLPRNPTGHRVQKEEVVGGACFRLNERRDRSSFETLCILGTIDRLRFHLRRSPARRIVVWSQDFEDQDSTLSTHSFTRQHRQTVSECSAMSRNLGGAPTSVPTPMCR